MPLHYYNEFDPKAAAWLKQLIVDGHIPKGEVDERSITEVRASDLAGFRQCHFFAGIGGWPEALRIAGVGPDRPVTTGSCPCQPFSCAGQQKGVEDSRHLWPVWFQLIRGCKHLECFQLIVGEQVERAVGLGWLDGIFADLEGESYTCGASVLGAHSVRAPNIRQRLYWLSHTNSRELQRISSAWEQPLREQGKRDLRGLAHANGGKEHAADAGGFHAESGACGNSSDGMADAARGGRGEQRGTNRAGCGGHSNSGGETIGVGGLGDTLSTRLEGHTGNGDNRNESGRIDSQSDGSITAASSVGFWDRFDIINFKDGKTRRIEPGLEPLVNGVPCRVDLLRGYGNAINPWTAAEFIKAAFEVLADSRKTHQPLLAAES